MARSREKCLCEGEADVSAKKPNAFTTEDTKEHGGKSKAQVDFRVTK